MFGWRDMKIIIIEIEIEIVRGIGIVRGGKRVNKILEKK